MSPRALVFGAELAVPRERAFAALTEAADLARWFCDACESEPRANGRLVMRWTRSTSSREPFEARWVEFVPPERAAFQGGHAGYPDRDAGTVWFSLTETATGSHLAVRHELPDREGYDAMLEPWRAAWTRALDRLARLLAAAEQRC